MIAQVHSATLLGIEALPIVVEADLTGPIQNEERHFVLVGLPDKAVQESKERVRVATRNSGLDFPSKKILVNLAPGDIRKEGPWLDLPMAIALCAVTNQVPREELAGTLFLGELGLDGALRPINGAVSVALMAAERGFTRLVVPAANGPEASVAMGVEVYGVRNLLEAVELLNGSPDVKPVEFDARPESRVVEYAVDYRDVKGQRHAVRALEIAAAGGHNALMSGPPGSGKTMLARRLPTILPPLGLEEAIQVTRVHSAAGEKGNGTALVWERPFRSPHHSASHAALVGGGKNPKPGEISLAHHGVLFLDEFPELDRASMEALRQPLEDGVITVSRVSNTVTFPAECILVAAMNPCPCGFKGLPEAKCVGVSACERYGARISGPLRDRIDLHLEVPRLKPDELIGAAEGEPSATIRERVLAARERQTARLGPARTNAKMSPRELKDTVSLDAEAEGFMRLVAARMNLSARVFDRILKVGRTIADLAAEPEVRKAHLAEAVQCRDRGDS